MTYATDSWATAEWGADGAVPPPFGPSIVIALTESGDDFFSALASVIPHAIAVTIAAAELGDDTFSATITQPEGSDLGEPITLTDSSTGTGSLVGAGAESAGLAETTTAYVTKFAAQAESITISDAWAATLIQLGTLSPGTRIIKRGHYDRAITREPNRLVPLEVGETDVLTFDYTDRLVDAETIVSAVTTISVVNGTDPSPSGLLVGTTQVTTPYALQKVTGAVRNVTYLCYCAATTSTGRVLVNAGLLPVIAFGQP